MQAEVLGVRHAPLDAPLPPGATDCHTHVFGPAARFPLDPARKYTPGEAPVAELAAHQKALGLSRVVIVQPSPYGTGNACTLDGMAALGDTARGVAVIDPDLPLAALKDLHAAGMRGARLNLQTAGQSDPAIARAMLLHAAEQVAPLGWHVQVYTNLAVLAGLHDVLLTLQVPLVVDHFGSASSVDQPGFEGLLELVQRGQAYVKLSAPHRLGAPDAAPLAAALIAANPARMLWGSDWPHTAAHGLTEPLDVIEPFNPVDDGAALNRLRRWAVDEATLRAILVDNPARLYGFPQ